MNDELYHHGVPNQKWGKRNGPPYPLNRTASGMISKLQRKRKDKAAKRKRSNSRKAYSEGKQAAKRYVRKMNKYSDASLKDRKARLQLEKDVKDLTNQVYPDSKFASTFKDVASRKAANIAANSLMALGQIVVLKTLEQNGYNPSKDQNYNQQVGKYIMSIFANNGGNNK